MELNGAIKLLKTHYSDKHLGVNPCGYTMKKATIYEDLFFNTVHNQWEEEDMQSEEEDIISVCCTECDEELLLKEE